MTYKQRLSHWSCIHAFPHRQEGDGFNAAYGFRQAGKKFPQATLKEEQIKLVEYFLENQD